ncbi:MAG: ABC transporter ATP-binding protein [Chloroflexi bacterium]|nr:ABC transporter ATP-binding protein [Chloroflexota bacterium]
MLDRESILRLNGLTKSYGHIRAVNHLSLEVYRGEIFGLLGPNGAGKTTTINLISGFLKPDSGEVLLHGKPITGGEGDFRNRIGICPQENVHWKKLTVIEQLRFLGDMYGLKTSLIRSRSQEICASLGLEEVANRLGGNLSGGMQRRLNIALALIHDPELLILDEPEAGLDPQSRISIREFIKSLARDKTILLTTHNMDEADRLADRLAIMDQGELLVLDTPETLKANVGEGDVLEISLLEVPAGFGEKNLNFKEHVRVTLVEDCLQIRALDLVNLLPEILARLDAHGVKTAEIRLRNNSLEDVFIQLTGRRLRE